MDALKVTLNDLVLAVVNAKVEGFITVLLKWPNGSKRR